MDIIEMMNTATKQRRRLHIKTRKNNYWNNQWTWGDWMNWGRPVNVDKTDLVWNYHNLHDNGGEYFTINGRPINRNIVTYNPFYSKEINDTVYIYPSRTYYIRTPYRTELGRRQGNYLSELFDYRCKYQIAPSNSVITLRNAGRASGARVNPNLLDSIALNAGKENYPIDKALGLAVKESTLMPVNDDAVDLYSDWDYTSQSPYFSDLVEVRKVGRGFPNPELLGKIIDDKKVDQRARDYAHSLKTPYKGPKDESPIRHAIRKYKTAPKSYNPGLGLNYHDLVNENAVLIMRSPLIINWWNTSGNYWYNKGLQSKKKGGKMIKIKKAQEGTSLEPSWWDLMPIYGTYRDYLRFNNLPNWRNGISLAVSGLGDVLSITGIGAIAKGLTAANKARKISLTALNASDIARTNLWKSRRILKREADAVNSLSLMNAPVETILKRQVSKNAAWNTYQNALKADKVAAKAALQATSNPALRFNPSEYYPMFYTNPSIHAASLGLNNLNRR